MKYPKEVPVLEPGQVGTRDYYYKNGQPRCALGWYWRTFDGDDRTKQFQEIYTRCAAAVGVNTACTNAAGINDRCDPLTRALLVNATFAALGYVVGQQPEAVKLARKAGYKV